MKIFLNRASLIGLAMFAALACCWAHGESPGGIESYPSRPIRWIVPYPAGGPTDLVARIVGQRLGERLKQPVLVENRAGAFGNIGLEAAARAAPDGYTIVFGMTSLVLNPILYKLNFDPLTELTAISQLTTVTYVLLANADFPPRTLPELLVAAKERPGAVTCGWGATLFQLGCELLNIQGRVNITLVPYKGNAPAMNDLIGGQINLLFDPANTALPQTKSGRVRAIATANLKRSAGPFGGIPTVSETLRGFELSGWFGVLAPAATPRTIISRLNREIAAVLEEDEVRNRLVDSGLEVAHGSPEAFAEIIRRDHAKYLKIVQEAGIKAE
jgi:tripartite-type tricarboxylate transporter receptor subunit TctC